MRQFLVFIFACTSWITVSAGGLIGDVIQGIDSSIIENASGVDSPHQNISIEAQSLRALSICQEKCSICFDGIDCDFECVKKTCLNDSEILK